MQTAVVILNYNGKFFLEKFLPKVLQFTPNADVIVADNASTDDSVAFLQEKFPTLPLILLPQNYGFSKGYNEALRTISPEQYTFLLLLNSDVEPTAEWLEPLENFMQQNPQVAACQPKIKAYHEPQKFEYAGAAGGMLDKYGFAFCRGRIFDSTETDTQQYETNTPVFWATGACMMVRTEAFWKVGGFDDDFFAHMEEIDLCWRLHSIGYEIYYVANSTIFHVGGGTLAQGSPRKTFLNYRNNLAMIVKNYPTTIGLIRLLLIRFLLDFVALIRFLSKKDTKQATAIFKAYWHFYKKFGFWREKRRNTLKSKNSLAKIFPKSIVWLYFVRGKKKASLL
ncbi:MAG: glycosyltransferase family 2 protein [Cytophagales bacterium]|nr:MAG: glycosyltransferase family 2 protein [Cytophagales bacterium]